jgi:hypothetical protein
MIVWLLLYFLLSSTPGFIYFYYLKSARLDVSLLCGALVGIVVFPVINLIFGVVYSMVKRLLIEKNNKVAGEMGSVCKKLTNHGELKCSHWSKN